MRITHQMLTRNHINRMNTTLGLLTRSNSRMASGRAYERGNENVGDAGKALKNREMISHNQRFQNTIRDVEGRVGAAEDSIRTVNELLIAAKGRMVQGMNGVMGQEDRDKIAIELERAQEEVMQLMNIQFADKNLFAASGNADGSPPFATNAAGNLVYNGSVVDDLVKNPTTGRPATKEMVAGSPVYTDIPFNEPNFIDIGLNFRLDANGNVDPNTGFRDTFSGVESFGFGRNADGMPLNAHSLLGQMAKDLRSGDVESMGKGLNAIGDSMNFLLTTITEIGARSTTLTNTANRLEQEFITLADTQNKLEGVDIAQEAINNKNYERSWLVTLQLGSKVLPQSIFDFIR